MMKKLLSLLLAAALTASMALPAAAQTLPLDEPVDAAQATLTEDAPAAETEAAPVPQDDAAQQTDTTPAETPEAPQDETVPAETPEAPQDETVPAETPEAPQDEAVPAETPAAPQDETVPAETPEIPQDETVPAETPETPQDEVMPAEPAPAANENGGEPVAYAEGGEIPLYLDSATGTYFAKLPMQYYTGTGYLNSVPEHWIYPIGDSIWFFSAEAPAEGATWVISINGSTAYDMTYYTLRAASGEAPETERPPLMITAADREFMNSNYFPIYPSFFYKVAAPVQAGPEYEYTLDYADPDASRYTLVGYSQPNGFAVSIDPDAKAVNFHFTDEIYEYAQADIYPEIHTYWRDNESGRLVHTSYSGISSLPGRWRGDTTSALIPELISDEGTYVQPRFGGTDRDGAYRESYGVRQFLTPTEITGELMIGYSDHQPATGLETRYDADRDSIFLKMPASTLEQYLNRGAIVLNLTLKDAAGHTLRQQVELDGLSVSSSFRPTGSNFAVLGLTKGSTLTGTMTFSHSDDTTHQSVPVTLDKDYGVQLQLADYNDIVSDSEAGYVKLEDYLSASYDHTTNQVTFEVLKDIKLREGVTSALVRAQLVNDLSYSFYTFEVSIGAAKLDVSGTAYWGRLRSAEGQRFAPRIGNATGWAACYGTPTRVEARICDSNGSTLYSDNLTAEYDPESDEVCVKLTEDLQTFPSYAYLYLDVAFEGGAQGYASIYCSKDYVQTRLQRNDGSDMPLVLGLTTGETLSATVLCDFTGQGMYDAYTPLITDQPLTVTPRYSNGIELDPKLVLSNYVEARLDNTTGVLTVTVKKDITLSANADRPEIRFTIDGLPMYDISVSVPVGKGQLSFWLRTDGPSTVKAQVGASRNFMPTTSYATLKELGIAYKVRFRAGSNVMTDEEAAQYFDVKMLDDGSFTVTVKKVPPLRTNAGKQNYYVDIALDENGPYYSTSYWPLLDTTVTARLQQDGKAVSVIPLTPGTYDYTVLFTDDAGSPLKPGLCYVDARAETSGSSVSASMVGTDKLRVTVAQGAAQTSDRLHLNFYSDVGDAEITMPMGRQSISLNANLSFDQAGKAIPLTFLVNGVYLPASLLDDSGFTIRVSENGETKPLAESTYFTASIQGGKFTFAFKEGYSAGSLAAGRYAFELSYNDAKYSGQGMLRLVTTVSAAVDSGYLRLSLVHTRTGSSFFVGEPGTVDVYRAACRTNNGERIDLVDVAGDALEGFTFTCRTSPSLDVTKYVDFSYNLSAGTVTFKWKEKLPLFNADKTVSYNYVVAPIIADSSLSIDPDTSLTSAYSLWDAASGSRDLQVPAGGSRTFSVYGAADLLPDDDAVLRVLDTEGREVDKSLLEAKLGSYGIITVTAAANCPQDAAYYLDYRATTGNGRNFLCNNRYRLTVVPGVVNYQYHDTGSFYGWTSVYNEYSSIKWALSTSSDNRLGTDLVLAPNSDASTFTIEGLTLGSYTPIEGGYHITWNDDPAQQSRSERVTLKAALDNDRTVETVVTVTVEANTTPDTLTFLVDGSALPADAPLSGAVNLNRTYTVTPLYNGKLFSKSGAALKHVLLKSNQECFTIQNVKDDSFEVVPTTAGSFSLSAWYTFEEADGTERTVSAGFASDAKVGQSKRLQFRDSSGAGITSVDFSSENRSATLMLDFPQAQIKNVVYTSTLPSGTITWEQDESDPRKVTLQAAIPFIYGTNYFYATVTCTDGTSTTAYARLYWNSSSSRENSTLPNGYNIVFGNKSENGSLESWGSTGATIYENAPQTTGRMYVFYRKYGSGINSTSTDAVSFPDLVTSLEVKVTSRSDDGLTITKQGKENDLYFFEFTYQCTKPAEYIFTATATLNDGTTRTKTFSFTIGETSRISSTVPVENSQDLAEKLKDVTLLPGSTLQLAKGTYTGDYTIDIPLTIMGDLGGYPNVDYEAGTVNGFLPYGAPAGTSPSEGVVFKGTLRAAAEDVTVENIHFDGSGKTGDTALTDVSLVAACIFTGYDTAIAFSRDLAQTSSVNSLNNVFESNNTAIHFFNDVAYSRIEYSAFINNGSGIVVDENCPVTSSFSPAYKCHISNATITSNRFYLHPDQMAFVNNSQQSDAGFNLSYNFFRRINADGSKNEIPTQDMFKDANGYFEPYYDTWECRTILSGSGTLEEPDKNKSSNVTLTASPDSYESSADGIDSSLELSATKFEQLKEADPNDVDALSVTVQSNEGETDVVWTFKREDLNDEFEGKSVNLGVDFTFTDYEKDMVSNIVKERPPAPGDDNVEDIAYQAMCFSHSGALPGKATVRIRMNESLLQYYNDNGQSFANFKVYYLNMDTGMLEDMTQQQDDPVTINVVNEDGEYYLELTITHCSSYIITPASLDTGIVGLEKILAKVGSGYTIDRDLNFLFGLQPGTLISQLLDRLIGSINVFKPDHTPVTGTDKIGTGYTLELGPNGSIDRITAVVKGDVDGSATVDVMDIIGVRDDFLGISDLTGAREAAAHVSTDLGADLSVMDIMGVRDLFLNSK